MRKLVFPIVIFSFISICCSTLYPQTSTPVPISTLTPSPTRNVVYISDSGSNDNSGGPGDPWLTLTYATKYAGENADIRVFPGKYEYMDPISDPMGVGEKFPVEPWWGRVKLYPGGSVLTIMRLL